MVSSKENHNFRPDTPDSELGRMTEGQSAKNRMEKLPRIIIPPSGIFKINPKFFYPELSFMLEFGWEYHIAISTG